MNNLNRDQQRGLDKVGIFLKSEERILAIKGGAGTGKSFLIDAIYRQYSNIRLTATTNEAANVIGGITIHRYLGFALGCNKENPGILANHEVILIDEASMLKLCILKYILNETDNKIILVGDPNQLTVGTTINLNDYPSVELNQNMRSKSEHLVRLVKHLDECVARQIYPDMKSHIGSHLEFVENHRDFLKYMDEENDNYLLVAYQNNIVDRYVEAGYDALTTHKSQGKSYPVVYIDARDLMVSHTKKKNQFNNPIDMDTYLRLLSVAVSRAMYKVYCYIGENRWK